MPSRTRMQPGKLNPDDIAAAMVIPENALWHMAHNVSACFKPTRKRMIRGKVRGIDAPYREDRKRLRVLHRFLRSWGPHDAVHGGRTRRSCMTAAHRHKGKSIVVTRDIQDCYPSIKTAALFKSLVRYGFRRDTSRLLSFLMTPRGRIAQGSPLSADALNYHLFEADQSLRYQCRRLGFEYTRTYDDFVASGSRPQDAPKVGHIIKAAVERLGLNVSQRKRWRNGFQPSRREQRVHNIVVNSPLGVSIPAEQTQTASEDAEAFLRGVISIRPQTIIGLAHRRQRLVGRMSYFRQATFAPVRELRNALNKGDQIVLARLRKEGVFHGKKWWKLGKRDATINALADRWVRARATALVLDA